MQTSLWHIQIWYPFRQIQEPLKPPKTFLFELHSLLIACRWFFTFWLSTTNVYCLCAYFKICWLCTKGNASIIHENVKKSEAYYCNLLENSSCIFVEEQVKSIIVLTVYTLQLTLFSLLLYFYFLKSWFKIDLLSMFHLLKNQVFFAIVVYHCDVNTISQTLQVYHICLNWVVSGSHGVFGHRIHSVSLVLAEPFQGAGQDQALGATGGGRRLLRETSGAPLRALGRWRVTVQHPRGQWFPKK